MLAFTPTAVPYVTSAFDPKRKHPITGKIQPHTGADFRATTGTPIRATAAGTVQRSAYDPPRAQGGTGAGNHVRVDHGGGITTRYYHLSRRDVAVGQRVTAGQVIGLAGSTGDSTAAHLHFEVRINGTPIDPIPWLAAQTAAPAQEDDMPLTAADATLINSVVINVLRSAEAKGIIRAAVLDAKVSDDTGTLAQTTRDARVIARRVEQAIAALPAATGGMSIDYAALARAVNDDAARRLSS